MLVKLEVYHDGESWCARGIGHDIFTQGESADQLFENIREAVATHFENGAAPVDIDILIVSEMKLRHVPAASG